MTDTARKRRGLYAKLAVGAVVVLAALLALRATGWSRSAAEPEEVRPAPVAAPQVAPRANVPEPPPIDLAALPTPTCWGCPSNKMTSLEFSVDLDLLAPLGDGPGNAAVWMYDFRKTGGSRLEELGEAQKRGGASKSRSGKWKVLRPDDPLLLEAEAWMDQAECSFYPELFEMDGVRTEVPNLLFAVVLAKSWVDRGAVSEDPEAAKEDYRRAVRLGRLLLQDDMTLIQNLVGFACIRWGAEALYEAAREEGDAATMLAAGLVIGDCNGIRQQVSARIAGSWVTSRYEHGLFGPSLNASDASVEKVCEAARTETSRTLRGEAIITLYAIKHAGTRSQRARAVELLDELAAEEDELVSELARWVQEEPYDREMLEQFTSWTP
jgi:hypothetical protein